jgi:hypothetical protein
MQSRRRAENVVQEDCRLAGSDPPLAFGGGEAIGDFRRENIGRDEYVNAMAVLIAQTNRLAGVDFWQNPLESHAAIENVRHG